MIRFIELRRNRTGEFKGFIYEDEDGNIKSMGEKSLVRYITPYEEMSGFDTTQNDQDITVEVMREVDIDEKNWIIGLPNYLNNNHSSFVQASYVNRIANIEELRKLYDQFKRSNGNKNFNAKV